jgi:hypothetical protein
MRRWVLMSVLSAALLAVPLWGQRSGHGGMAGGGGRVGSVGAPRGGGYGGGGYHGGYGHRPYGYPGHYPYHSGGIRYCLGCYPWRWGYGRYGYPSALWGLYGGIGWSGAYDSYPAQADPANVYVNPDNANNYVAEQQQREIDRLDEEVERLRAERESGASRSSMQQAPTKEQISAKTVLVYRKYHVEEIENYAIVGQTLWVFTEQRARKIPIAELDMPATTYANELRGIDFQLPTK